MASRNVVSLAPSGSTIGSGNRRDQDTTQLRKLDRSDSPDGGPGLSPRCPSTVRGARIARARV